MIKAVIRQIRGLTPNSIESVDLLILKPVFDKGIQSTKLHFMAA